MANENLTLVLDHLRQNGTLRTGPERIASESGARVYAHHFSKITTRIKRMNASTLAAANP